MGTNFYGRDRSSESFGLVAGWANALNGNGDLAECLEQLMRLVRADAALITRICLKDSKSRYIARCTLRKGEVWPTQPRAFTVDLLGDCLRMARTGSIWKLSEAEGREGASLHGHREPQAGKFAEIIAIPLWKGHASVDVLELQYLHSPAQHDLDLVVTLIGTLSSCWGSRVSGVIAKTLVRGRKLSCVEAPYDSDVPLLDCENPAHLSRSEFRVCTLLKEGMTVCAIAESLSIAPATVRTHLSSVFSKTGTSNQVELLHKLNRQKAMFAEVANRRSI